MKRKILSVVTIMVFTVLGWGCGSNASTKEEEVIPVVTKLVLTADKESISANGSEEVNLSVTVYDQSNNVMSGESYTLYNGETIFENSKFATTTPGAYIFKAKSGNVVSNEVTITAADVSPKATTIEFKSDVNTILADGSEKATFTVEVFDQYGDLYTTKAAISYGDGESATTLSAVTFTTKVPGEYKFKASCENLVSEPITILVPELITVTNLSKSKDYSEILGVEVYSIGFEVTTSSITKLMFTESTNTSPYEVTVTDKKATIEKLMVDSSLKTITVTAYNSRNRVVGNPITVKLKN